MCVSVVPDVILLSEETSETSEESSNSCYTPSERENNDDDANTEGKASRKEGEEKKRRVDYTEAEESPKKKMRNNCPGQRRVGRRVYDSEYGRTCHWCRQKTVEPHVQCWRCPRRFCGPCLANRNGENIVDEMQKNVRWICPKCRNGCGPGCRNCCNCSLCRRSQYLSPTGQLIHTVRIAGFSNVHDYLVHKQTGETPAAIAKRKEGRGWTKATGALVTDQQMRKTTKANSKQEESRELAKSTNNALVTDQKMGKTTKAISKQEESRELAKSTNNALVTDQQVGKTTKAISKEELSRALAKATGALVTDQQMGTTTKTNSKQEESREFAKSTNNALVTDQQMGKTTEANPKQEESRELAKATGALVTDQQMRKTTNADSKQEESRELAKSTNDALVADQQMGKTTKAISKQEESRELAKSTDGALGTDQQMGKATEAISKQEESRVLAKSTDGALGTDQQAKVDKKIEEMDFHQESSEKMARIEKLGEEIFFPEEGGKASSSQRAADLIRVKEEPREKSVFEEVEKVEMKNATSGEVVNGCNSAKDLKTEYARELHDTLQRPFSTIQLKEILDHVKLRKKVTKTRHTRNRMIEVPTHAYGRSYLDHYPDLAAVLAKTSSPEEQLKLLRGFLFWLKHSCMEGSFRPWLKTAAGSDNEEEDCYITSGPDCQIIKVLMAIDTVDYAILTEEKPKPSTRRNPQLNTFADPIPDIKPSIHPKRKSSRKL